MRTKRFIAVAVAALVLSGVTAQPASPLFGNLLRGISPIVQTLNFKFPANILPRYGFCNAQSCGTSENLDCVGNQYIPGHLGDFMRTLDISALSGKLLSADISYGTETPTSGGMGGLLHGVSGIVAKVLPNGGLHIDFPWEKIAGLTGSLRPLSGIAADLTEKELSCGIPEEQKSRVAGAFPEGFKNDFANIILKLTWEPSERSRAYGGLPEPLTQTITINGSPSTINIAPPAPAGEPKPDAATFDQTSFTAKVPKATGTGDVNFADVGTVPTVAAMAFTQLGLKANPTKIGEALRTAGQWRPGEGTDLIGSLGSAGTLAALATAAGNTTTDTFAAGPTTLLELTYAMIDGTLVGSVLNQVGEKVATSTTAVMAWPPISAKNETAASGGAAVITGYDPETDKFSLVNSLGKKIEVDFETMAKTMQRMNGPRIVQISRLK